jgi:hypothetical protein
MYITNTEYASLTDRAAAEATAVRIKIACKLLDSRIGNYPTYENGWKIDNKLSTWYIDNYTELTQDQKEAVQMWVAGMIEYFVVNGTMSSNNDNIKLGRFSVNKSKNSQAKILPDEMNYYDTILVSSGLINRSINTK